MTETWYARLLRIYPAGHPRDEMLDVLLTSGAPFRREVVPLVLGGLRARSGGDQSPAQRWLYAARAAALMLLLLTTLQPLPDNWPRGGLPTAAWIAATLAAVAVMAGVRRPAAALALAAFVLTATDGGIRSAVTGYALVCVLLLIPGPRTPVAGPLPWALVLFASIDSAPAWFLYAILAGTVLWAAAVDERILIAIGITAATLLVQAVDHVALFLSQPDLGGIDLVRQIMLPAVVYPAVPLVIGTAIALRRSRV